MSHFGKAMAASQPAKRICCTVRVCQLLAYLQCRALAPCSEACVVGVSQVQVLEALGRVVGILPLDLRRQTDTRFASEGGTRFAIEGGTIL